MTLYALRFIGTIVVSASTLVGTALAAPINIDTFDLGSAQAVAMSGPATTGAESITDTSQTIGGVRHYSVAGLGTGGAGMATLVVAADRLGLGTLTIAAPYAAQWTLRYGYTPSLTPNDMNADLVGTGNSDLRIDMLFAEYAYDLAVSLVSNGHSVTTQLLSLPAHASAQPVWIPFSSFAGIDPHDVDQIAVQWTGQPNGDYIINAIVADVPEPATLMLLASGALLALYRRRAA